MDQQAAPNPVSGSGPVTLRDLFAAFALAGQIAAHANPQSDGHIDAAREAVVAYRLADAMLAARAPR